MSFIGTRPRLNIAVFPTYIAQNKSEESYMYFDFFFLNHWEWGSFLSDIYKKKVTIFNAQKSTSCSQKINQLHMLHLSVLAKTSTAN